MVGTWCNTGWLSIVGTREAGEDFFMKRVVRAILTFLHLLSLADSSKGCRSLTDLERPFVI